MALLARRLSGTRVALAATASPAWSHRGSPGQHSPWRRECVGTTSSGMASDNAMRGHFGAPVKPGAGVRKGEVTGSFGLPV
jgi:hypothetical protein